MLCGSSAFVKAAGQSCACAVRFFLVSFSSSQSFRNHAERKDIRERIEEKDTAEGENSQELHGEGYGSTYICSHCPTNSRADTPDT